NILMDMVSVTGPGNLMAAATWAAGITAVENAAREPAVEDLANFLNGRGADIRTAGTQTLTIQGTARLPGGRYRVHPDRSETGTCLVAALATGGDVTCRHTDPRMLDAVLRKLTEAGAVITKGDDWIRLQAQGRPKAVNIVTAP